MLFVWREPEDFYTSDMVADSSTHFAAYPDPATVYEEAEDYLPGARRDNGRLLLMHDEAI